MKNMRRKKALKLLKIIKRLNAQLKKEHKIKNLFFLDKKV